MLRVSPLAVASLLSTIGSLLILQPTQVAAQQECITSAQTNTPNYWKVQPAQTFATVFNLEYSNDQTSKAIAVNTAGEGIDYTAGFQELDDQKRYFLRQCGSDAQPENPDDYVKNWMLEVPVTQVIVTATTQIGQLMVLDKIDTVKVYIGDPQYVTDQCFMDRIRNGDILVYDNQKDFADALVRDGDENRERLHELLNSKRTLMFGPVGSGWGGDARFIHNSTQTALLPSIDVLPYKERSSQGVFEWNEFYGAIYNEEKEARRMTLIKEKRWECIANKVEKRWNDDVFNSPKNKICWAYYLPDDYGYGVGWVWANKCDGIPEEDDFYCKFADDCHAELGTGDGNAWNENIYTTEETAEKFKDCYAIIYSSYYRNLVNVQEGEDPVRTKQRAAAAQVLESTDAWARGQVYDFTKSGRSNWYENRIVHYDRALEDFCSVANRHSKYNFYKRLFFRRLGPFPEPEGKDDDCIMIDVTDGSGRRLQTNCNTIATKQQCHKPEFRECKKRTAMCQLQKQCINKNFKLKYGPKNNRSTKKINCPRVRKRKGLIRKKRFTCSNKVVARNCAKRCGECCPQLG